MSRRLFSQGLIDLMLVDPNMLGDINTYALRSVILFKYQRLEKLIASLLKDLGHGRNISASSKEDPAVHRVQETKDYTMTE